MILKTSIVCKYVVSNVLIICFTGTFQRHIGHENSLPNNTSSSCVTRNFRPSTTQKSTFEVSESSSRTKRSKRPALQFLTPISFNLDDDGHVRKVYDKYVGISEGNSVLCLDTRKLMCNKKHNTHIIKYLILTSYTCYITSLHCLRTILICLAEYFDHGDPTFECNQCHALLWEAEAKRGNPNPNNKPYSLCCNKGKVLLSKTPETPKPLLDLFLNEDAKSQNFRNNIRTYNSMFAFTSMGGKVDDSINRRGRGPYVFRLHGQTYHSIGSLLPEPGAPPKFAQLYIYDTENETENRLNALR